MEPVDRTINNTPAQVLAVQQPHPRPADVDLLPAGALAGLHLVRDRRERAGVSSLLLLQQVTATLSCCGI